MVVAIDGPAGSGKSTIAALLAKRLGYFFLNSGLMYRSVTLKALNNKVPNEEQAIIAIARSTRWDIHDGVLFIDGEFPDSRLHSDKVDQYVSIVSAIPLLREIINKRIKQISLHNDLVVEGRDMTSIVFSDSKYRFYLDASVASRAARRFKQGISDLDIKELTASIQERDRADKNKNTGSLQIANGVLVIDTSLLTIEEVCAKVLESIQGQDELPTRSI